MADFWEPWQPQAGDAVRIRISGECEHEPREVLDGAGGRVLFILDPGEPLEVGEDGLMDVHGHRFAVVPNGLETYAMLAALEIDPA